MGTNNVISMVHRRAQRLAAEISSPAISLEPHAGEDIDGFIERVGNAIAEMIATQDRATVRNTNFSRRF